MAEKAPEGQGGGVFMHMWRLVVASEAEGKVGGKWNCTEHTKTRRKNVTRIVVFVEQMNKMVSVGRACLYFFQLSAIPPPLEV